MRPLARGSGLLAVLLCLAQTVPLLAQYSERLEVVIANVDVVVTDKKGKPVTGLTRDDFEIYEDGRRMEITNFAAYDAATSESAPGPAGEARQPPKAQPQPKPQPKLFVLFVDIQDIEPYRRAQFFESVRQFLGSARREGDLVAVLTWNRRIRTLLEPTVDAERIDVVIDGLSEPYRDRERRVARELSEMIIDQAAMEAELFGTADGVDPDADREFEQFIIDEQRCQATKRKARELRTTLAAFSRIELRKILLFAGDDLSLNPGGRCLTKGDIDALADTANAYGMAIHALHPPGARDHRATRPDRGGMPAMTGGDPNASAYSRAWDEAGGLLTLAERTGGHIGVGAPQSAKVLQQVVTELDSYYSLGYRMGPGREDRPRALKVVAKNPKHEVRARQSVVRISEAARLRDLVTTNLYLPPPQGQQRPSFEAATGETKRDGRYLVVDVRLSVRAQDLLTTPAADGTSRGSFSVFVAAGRELGDASDVAEATQEFDAPPPGDEDAVIEYSFGARMRPDTRRLSIAVRDNLTGEVATRVVAVNPG